MRKSLLLILAAAALLLPQSAQAADSTLVRRVAAKLAVPEDKAKQSVETVFTAIEEELKAGNDVAIQRFGKFTVSQRKERMGRNPKTGAAIKIPARKYPKFSSSDVLKRSVNQLESQGTAQQQKPL